MFTEDFPYISYSFFTGYKKYRLYHLHLSDFLYNLYNHIFILKSAVFIHKTPFSEHLFVTFLFQLYMFHKHFLVSCIQEALVLRFRYDINLQIYLTAVSSYSPVTPVSAWTFLALSVTYFQVIHHLYEGDVPMSEILAGYEQATGKIDYTLTNNYMFHIILQENEPVLRCLISSLLHLPLEEISSVVIKNPIIPGTAIDMKEFILDLYITLNNNIELNLEMQVNNLFNWPNRSLSYLCRTFDNLCRGQDYHLTKPAIHIGIVDFTLFPNAPEFYATYKRYCSHPTFSLL